MGTSSEIMKGDYEAFGEGDVPAELGAMDPDIQWRKRTDFCTPTVPVRGTASHRGGRLSASRDRREGIHRRPKNIIDGGQTVVVEGRCTKIVKSTGTPFDAQCAHVWEIRNGRIVRFQQYTERLQWSEASGA